MLIIGRGTWQTIACSSATRRRLTRAPHKRRQQRLLTRALHAVVSSRIEKSHALAPALVMEM
jgi:hypothetical protein